MPSGFVFQAASAHDPTVSDEYDHENGTRHDGGDQSCVVACASNGRLARRRFSVFLAFIKWLNHHSDQGPRGNDTGKVIGRQGRTAQSLRVIVQAIGREHGKDYKLDIEESSPDTK